MLLHSQPETPSDRCNVVTSPSAAWFKLLCLIVVWFGFTNILGFAIPCLFWSMRYKPPYDEQHQADKAPELQLPDGPQEARTGSDDSSHSHHGGNHEDRTTPAFGDQTLPQQPAPQR